MDKHYFKEEDKMRDETVREIPVREREELNI